MSNPHDPFTPLAERGHERGARAVLDGARRAARRYHRRRQALVGGAGSLAVLSAAVGVGLYMREDSGPNTLAQAPPDDPPAGDPAGALTGIRIEDDGNYEIIVLEVSGPAAPAGGAIGFTEQGDLTLPSDDRPPWPGSENGHPECDVPADFHTEADGTELMRVQVPSGVMDTPDGLPPEVSGLRVQGSQRHVLEVMPLCAVDGQTWVAFELTLQPQQSIASCATTDPSTSRTNVMDLTDPMNQALDPNDPSKPGPSFAGCPSG